MPVNQYFNNYSSTPEQNLIEDLVIESIKMYGIDVHYMKRVNTSIDGLLNEDDLPLFDNATLIEMYIKNVDGFEGEGDFLSKFGVEIRDSMTLTVATKVFDTTITGRSRPFEGDLIYFPLNKKVYKIMHAEHEPVFYQMGALQMYDLRCELMEYSGEKFETGITAIDTIFDGIDITTANTIADLGDIDPFADNSEIEDEANSIIDWSETNPFSESGW